MEDWFGRLDSAMREKAIADAKDWTAARRGWVQASAEPVDNARE
jgi:hypothetical protein